MRRLSNDELRALCVKNGWFTCGTNRQYERVFLLNELGYTEDIIAVLIWLCSDDENDDDIDDIRDAIVRAEENGEL